MLLSRPHYHNTKQTAWQSCNQPSLATYKKQLLALKYLKISGCIDYFHLLSKGTLKAAYDEVRPALTLVSEAKPRCL